MNKSKITYANCTGSGNDGWVEVGGWNKTWEQGQYRRPAFKITVGLKRLT